MRRIAKILVADVKANAWCLFHLGHSVLTCFDGCEKVNHIEVGTGSLFGGTWKTVRVFYHEGEAR
jgi:hypothetical protein